MKNKNKKGISPLIATVLIIGFTVVIAALVITWGTNLFKKTQTATAETSDINIACTEVIGNLDLKLYRVAPNTFTMTLDNGVSREVNGFVVRVQNIGDTIADVLDTDNVTQAAQIIPGNYLVPANTIRTFNFTYNNGLVPNATKVVLRPKVVIEGIAKQCPGQGITKEV
ncbi:hypothetical protein J4216_02920 [Candidatus Woesearchaeota archaeon]|nr:hypothetical protein [Candidatus Woesearchaeota archaeon]